MKKLLFLFLFFTSPCKAQPVQADTMYFVTGAWSANPNYIQWTFPTLTANYLWKFPNGNGTGTGLLTNDGSGTLSWTSLSGLGSDFIINGTSLQSPATFNISGNGFIGGDALVSGTLFVTGPTELSNVLQVTGAVTLSAVKSSSSPLIAIPQVDYLGNLTVQTEPAGAVPICDGGTNEVWAVPIAGPGILITPGTGSLTIASDIDSQFTAGPGIDFAGSTAGNLHINSHADSTGAKFVLNTNNLSSAQSPGGFNLYTSAAITGSFIDAKILNQATSSTSSIINVALNAGCTGVNTGTSSKNIALQLGAANGTLNYDIYGDFWNVDNTGTLTLGTPLTVPNGGTGVATGTAHSIPIFEGTSALANTGAGTAGMGITSNGSGSDPSYQFAPVAYAWVNVGITTGGLVTIESSYNVSAVISTLTPGISHVTLMSGLPPTTGANSVFIVSPYGGSGVIYVGNVQVVAGQITVTTAPQLSGTPAFTSYNLVVYGN